MKLRRVLVLALVPVTCAACSGGGAAGANDAAQALDAAASPTDGMAPSPDTGPADRPEPVDMPADIRPSLPGLPLPSGVAPPLRILDSAAMLTGDGLSSCSHQDPPSGDGDRWCAFYVKSTAADTTELWVMDVTRAAARSVPRCNGSDAGCLRLTSNLWTASPTVGPFHPYSHAFDGDTLIFYADSTSTAQELHRGPVYAWRPGWPRPRQIASAKGFLCTGHPRAAVAYCLEDLVGDPDKPDSFEIRAGSVADPAGGELTSLGRVRPFRADSRLAWQVAFSPAGDVLALSSPDPDPTVETLRVIPTGDIGRASPTEIVRDITSWAISNDGTKIYFQRVQAGNRNDLYVSAFPTGSSVTSVAQSIQDFVIVGDGPADQGVAFLTRLEMNQVHFRLVSDTTMPTSTRDVFSSDDMLEDARISPDGRFTAWRSGDLLARIVRHTDLGSCLLNSSARVRATAPVFLANAGLVFWTEDSPGDPNSQDGYVGGLDCQQRRLYAHDVSLELPVADRGYVFGDELDDESQTITLKYAGVARAGDGWRMGDPVRVHEHVAQTVVLVGTDPLLLVFRQKTGSQQEIGTYVFGPVPF